MWRIHFDGGEIDLCPALVSQLFADTLIPVPRKYSETGRLWLDSVTHAEPIRALSPRCDVHGDRCP